MVSTRERAQKYLCKHLCKYAVNAFGGALLARARGRASTSSSSGGGTLCGTLKSALPSALAQRSHHRRKCASARTNHAVRAAHHVTATSEYDHARVSPAKCGIMMAQRFCRTGCPALSLCKHRHIYIATKPHTICMCTISKVNVKRLMLMLYHQQLHAYIDILYIKCVFNVKRETVT